MEFDQSKLEEWIGELPGCGEFLINFFASCREDCVSAYVNYRSDLESYRRTHRQIRENYQRLLQAFEDISGMRIYTDG